MKIEDMKEGVKFWIQVEVRDVHGDGEVSLNSCDLDQATADEGYCVGGDLYFNCQADLDNSFVKSLTKVEANRFVNYKIKAIDKQISVLEEQRMKFSKELI